MPIGTFADDRPSGTMYREMDMTYWLEQAQAELHSLN